MIALKYIQYHQNVYDQVQKTNSFNFIVTQIEAINIANP
jgi:hypothetical protein